VWQRFDRCRLSTVDGFLSLIMARRPHYAVQLVCLQTAENEITGDKSRSDDVRRRMNEPARLELSSLTRPVRYNSC